MIIIRVELWSAVNGSRRELARMVLDNVGGTNTVGDYRVRTLRGRTEQALDKALLSLATDRPAITREGEVKSHPRLREHVWNLVAKALRNTGYGS